MTRTAIRSVALLVVMAGWSFVMDGQAQTAVRGTVFFSVDNDLFNGSDDHYSSGVQVGWVSGYLNDYAEAPVPSFLINPARALPRVNAEGRQRFVSYSLSHRIFTPNDITDSNFIPNDMPYSGLLLATMTAGAQDAQRMDAFSVIAGLVGPSAMGKHVQRSVHRAIGSAEPQGWHHQLRNEPLLNFDYEHRWRMAEFGSRRSWGGDVIGQAALAAGNLLTNGTLGIGARWGWRVSDDFGLPPQFFGEETIGSRPFTSTAGSNGAWLFVLVNGSAFANAIFWDGNTFEDSHLDSLRSRDRPCLHGCEDPVGPVGSVLRDRSDDGSVG